MKRLLSVLVYLLSIPAFAAAPPVDFSIGDKTTFNSVVNSTATIGGITVSAFTYSAGTYSMDSACAQPGKVAVRQVEQATETSMSSPTKETSR